MWINQISFGCHAHPEGWGSQGLIKVKRAYRHVNVNNDDPERLPSMQCWEIVVEYASELNHLFSPSSNKRSSYQSYLKLLIRRRSEMVIYAFIIKPFMSLLRKALLWALYGGGGKTTFSLCQG